jgi:hypothetical protein
VLLSPPVCARTRLAPRNSVIANIESFFILYSPIQVFGGPW